MHYFINIGSNLGDRRLNLSRAVRRIAEKYGWFEISHTVETEPWGYESENKFLNLAMLFITEDNPQEVQEYLQSIERASGSLSHRKEDGSYADRVLDIDIIAVDEQVIDTPGLIVPHPRMSERDFVLRPMEELAPLWRHPITGLTCTEMLASLPDKL